MLRELYKKDCQVDYSTQDNKEKPFLECKNNPEDLLF
jgi:hypothetical protein